MRRLRITPATTTFLWTRAVVWLAALLTAALFPITAGPATATAMAHGTSAGFGVDLWSRWDSGFFETIARVGYGNDGSAAFYPLYPALMGILGRILGGRYALAGLLISLAACLVCFELLWRVARARLQSESGASRAVLYLAVFPTAIFLQAVYSESLYLALALAAFLLAERGRAGPAAGAAALALLTRPTGIAVVAAVAVLAWPNRRALAWLAIVPVSFAVFPVILNHQFGQPWAFMTAESNWRRHLSALGPIGGLRDGISVLWRYPSDMQVVAINVEDLVYTIVFLALLWLVWRRCTLAESVFATISLALPLATPRSGHLPLMSTPRFGLVIFPFFLVLAQLGGRPRSNAIIIAASGILLGVEIVRWVTFQWVS